MHVPPDFAVDDPTTVVALARAAGYGHLVSTTGSAFELTPLPFIVDDGLTAVRAHLARGNRHWRTLDARPALLVVPVSDAYVSPAWYPSKEETGAVVPTWNYEVVLVHGSVRVHDDARWTASVVEELTALHETARAVDGQEPPAWSPDDAPPDFIRRQLRAIVGIELVVERVEAKRKLSQNRPRADREAVAEALFASNRGRRHEVATAMRRSEPGCAG